MERFVELCDSLPYGTAFQWFESSHQKGKKNGKMVRRFGRVISLVTIRTLNGRGSCCSE